MAAEFKKKGVNVLLGPVVGPLGRIALGGRNWEGFSSDPYLAGSLAYKSIEGIQSQGVIASTKVCCPWPPVELSLTRSSILLATNRKRTEIPKVTLRLFPPILMIRQCMNFISGEQKNVPSIPIHIS